MMTRLNYKELSPNAYKAMLGVEKTVNASGLEPLLLDLVRLRASQINGCGHCIDMHAKDLRARSETEQRIYLLSAWRESPMYSARERAALAWTECLTLVPEERAPDEVYEMVRKEFSELEIVHLTLAIVAINGWNRLNIAFGTVPGNYQPESARA